MGWPGIDFEELAEILPDRTLNDVREAVTVSLGHLSEALSKLEPVYQRSGYVSVREAIDEIKAAKEVLSGKRRRGSSTLSEVDS